MANKDFEIKGLPENTQKKIDKLKFGECIKRGLSKKDDVWFKKVKHGGCAFWAYGFGKKDEQPNTFSITLQVSKQLEKHFDISLSTEQYQAYVYNTIICNVTMKHEGQYITRMGTASPLDVGKEFLSKLPFMACKRARIRALLDILGIIDLVSDPFFTENAFDEEPQVNIESDNNDKPANATQKEMLKKLCKEKNKKYVEPKTFVDAAEMLNQLQK